MSSSVAHTATSLMTVLRAGMAISGLLDEWVASAPAVPWWTKDRPLRMASDSTGMGMAEISMRLLGSREGAQAISTKKNVSTFFDFSKPRSKSLKSIFVARAYLDKIQTIKKAWPQQVKTLKRIKGKKL